MRALLLAFAFALPLLSAAAECPAPAADREDDWLGQGAWQALERGGFRIGEISVEVTDIYETGDAWYTRGANFLHLETREQVVHQHLLVATGDLVKARRIYETERKLRNLGFFRAARVVPLACHDGIVDLRVEVKDSWTLLLSLKANHVGGRTATGLRIADRNFLGTGKEIFVEREDDGTRTLTRYAYDDPALFGSRWTMFVAHGNQSDGQSDLLDLQRPFHSFDQPWGFELWLNETTQDVSFYQDAEVAWRASTHNDVRTATVWRLLQTAGDSGWRAGLGVRAETREYGPALAVDPTLRAAPSLDAYATDGVRLAINRFHDHYATFSNITLVDRTEDINLGFTGTLSYTFGSGARYELALNWAGRPYPDGLVTFQMIGGVREADAGWHDGLVTTSLTWYDQSAERQTRLARLVLDWRNDPNPENEVAIGGEFGLLAYRSYEVVGDRAWRLHLEDRFYTDRVLFQTFKVGYSVVLEAGAARRIGTAQWSDTLADLGFGFRIGNLRGSFGQVLYFTVFTPLVDAPGLGKLQYVIGDVISF